MQHERDYIDFNKDYDCLVNGRYKIMFYLIVAERGHTELGA